MEKSRFTASSYVFLALWIFLCAGLFVPFVNVISISNRKNPSQKIYSRDAAVNGFVISYTHSVNKGRVHDSYRVEKDGSLTLYETEFVSYGAGIPEPEETPGAVFTVTDTGYFISNLNRNMNELVMAVGVIAEHSIKINRDEENEIFLKEIFAPQTSLKIKNQKINLLEYINYIIKKRRT
ncbi:MAG: DUF1850 domain-containing protein [Treponema sp.]|nr:DUF1850 domain-containing protein [Treponema sp.]